jgi:hypothetical protein
MFATWTITEVGPGLAWDSTMPHYRTATQAESVAASAAPYVGGGVLKRARYRSGAAGSRTRARLPMMWRSKERGASAQSQFSPQSQ